MSAALAEMVEPRRVDIQLPAKFAFLMELHRYKVAYGGRHGLKTHSFARALLGLGVAQELRVLGCREVLKSTKESQHTLLCDLIDQLGLRDYYEIQEHGIYARHNRTQFTYAGLSDYSAETIRSFEGVDVAWITEGQRVRKRSWGILIPTIRKVNSEIWVEFNPDMESDEAWQMFVVRPPADAAVVKTGWQYAKACGFWTEENERTRLYDLKYQSREDYENIWEGKCRQSVQGAIYAREVADMAEEKRIGRVPHDPRLPVHTVWDLGWNDAMAIIFVQKPTPTSVCVINYIEDSFRRYDQYVDDMRRLNYSYGRHYLPHDAGNGNPITGETTPFKVLGELLGRHNVKMVPRMRDKEDGIRAARMMFPRAYIDDTKRERATGHLGGDRLLTCLRNYRRAVPKTTGEPADPMHDQHAHGADAWAQLALVVDQIENFDTAVADDPGFLPPYVPYDAGMGVLG